MECQVYYCDLCEKCEPYSPSEHLIQCLKCLRVIGDKYDRKFPVEQDDICICYDCKLIYKLCWDCCISKPFSSPTESTKYFKQCRLLKDQGVSTGAEFGFPLNVWTFLYKTIPNVSLLQLPHELESLIEEYGSDFAVPLKNRDHFENSFVCSNPQHQTK